MAVGSWSLLEGLFTAGAAEFLTEIRRVHHGERLGQFAAKWHADRRPVARQFLLDYLDEPLNCFRHEALVKRLFKLAEKAGDDDMMGAMLVAFDRSVRKQRRTIQRTKYESFGSQAAATAAQAQWLREGYSGGSISQYGQRFQAYATKLDEVVITPPNTTMPKPVHGLKGDTGLNDQQRAKFEKKYRLFSVATRKYLRRRAWRYFRKLGATDPERYLRAASKFLLRYRDADIASEIHLLDNWGLMNCLFHGCPALHFPARGCGFVEGQTLANLQAAPRFEAAWNTQPEAFFTLMIAANCQAVRQWALSMLELHHELWLAEQPYPRLLMMIDSPDETIATMGYELLERMKDLAEIPLEQWLRRLEGDDLGKLTRLSDFLKKHLAVDRVSSESAIRLAMHRSHPVAELGFGLVQPKANSIPLEELSELVNAECDSVRGEILPWLRSVIIECGPIDHSILLAWLDSKHPDVRREGVIWLTEREAFIEVAVWIKLLESPYDDVRLPLIERISNKANSEPATLHGLYASVLTNVHRGGRQKPGVVKKLVDRISGNPHETETLLTLLAIAVRSLRGPEFRAGLAGLVRIANLNPELHSRVQEQFPEFTMGG